MPQVVTTRGAVAGLERCRQFLYEKSPEAAQRAAYVIVAHLQGLQNHPEMGRPLSDQPELRELIIPFGDSGYIALYRHVPTDGAIYILAFRHQKEAGY